MDADDKVIGDEPYVLELQVVRNENIETNQVLIIDSGDHWILKLKESMPFNDGKLSVLVSDIQGKLISDISIPDFKYTGQEIRITKPTYKGVFIISFINGNQIRNTKIINK